MNKIYKNEDGSLSMDGATWEDTSVPEDSPERWKPYANTYADYFKMRNEAVAQGKTILEGKDEKGEYYYIGEPEPLPAPTLEEKAQSIRSQRDALLSESDKYALVDNYGKLTAEEQAELCAYRTQLRDMPEQASFPDAVEFPQKPLFVKE